ncbi:hypothetical protein [Bacillus cereus]|uniref:hypothetical protein n=1 Tax=Bacillus cereus TaxID=1396 RepID=UPI003D65FF76
MGNVQSENKKVKSNNSKKKGGEQKQIYRKDANTAMTILEGYICDKYLSDVKKILNAEIKTLTRVIELGDGYEVHPDGIAEVTYNTFSGKKKFKIGIEVFFHESKKYEGAKHKMAYDMLKLHTLKTLGIIDHGVMIFPNIFAQSMKNSKRFLEKAAIENKISFCSYIEDEQGVINKIVWKTFKELGQNSSTVSNREEPRFEVETTKGYLIRSLGPDAYKVEEQDEKNYATSIFFEYMSEFKRNNNYNLIKKCL